MTHICKTLTICCLLTLEFIAKLPCLDEDTSIHVKMTLELLIFRPTLQWIFYDSIPLYLSFLWQSSHWKTVINYSHLLNRLIKIYRNGQIDETPGITGKKLLNIFVFIIKFLKTTWKQELMSTRYKMDNDVVGTGVQWVRRKLHESSQGEDWAHV